MTQKWSQKTWWAVHLASSVQKCLSRQGCMGFPLEKLRFLGMLEILPKSMHFDQMLIF